MLSPWDGGASEGGGGGEMTMDGIGAIGAIGGIGRIGERREELAAAEEEGGLISKLCSLVNGTSEQDHARCLSELGMGMGVGTIGRIANNRVMSSIGFRVTVANCVSLYISTSLISSWIGDTLNRTCTSFDCTPHLPIGVHTRGS